MTVIRALVEPRYGLHAFQELPAYAAPEDKMLTPKHWRLHAGGSRTMLKCFAPNSSGLWWTYCGI